jgi:hypothetical protein
MPKVLLPVVALLLATVSAQAARIRYHYAPVGNAGCMQLVPVAGGAPGERLSWVGIPPSPYHTAPRPTGCVAFFHPDTKAYLSIPLAVPPDTPRIRRWASTVEYDYGSEQIEIRFNADGSVDVIYNNGLMRSP